MARRKHHGDNLPGVAAQEKENNTIRRPCVYPGVAEPELAETISGETVRERMKACRKAAIQLDAIGCAIAHAIAQTDHVDVNKIVARLTTILA